MKILHAADLHICEKDIDEIDRCLQFMVTTAQAEQPDFTVIAGDIFDSREVRVDSRSAILAIGFVSALMDICPVAIILGTPSHDGEAPKIMKYAKGKFDCVVATHPMQVYLEDGFLYDRPAGGEDFKTPECIVTLIPQPTKAYWNSQAGIGQADMEIGAALSGVFVGFGAQAAEYPGVPHVLVYHGGVSGATVSTGQTMTGRDIEVSVDQLNMAGADLNLCGHIHAAQLLGDRTFYAGSPYRTNWGEAEAKGFYVHEIKPTLAPSMSGTHGRYAVQRFIETPCRKAMRLTADFTAAPIPETMADLFLSCCTDREVGPDLDVGGVSLRIDVTVWQDEADKIDREHITTTLMNHGAASVDLRITRVPRETVRAVEVLDAPTLRLKIIEQAKIRGEEVDPGILELADRLEQTPAEELLQQVVKGLHCKSSEIQSLSRHLRGITGPMSATGSSRV